MYVMLFGMFLRCFDTVFKRPYQYFSLPLQSNQVKRTPQDTINEFIIRRLNPLVVVDCRFVYTFLHVQWAVNSHAIQLRNFYQLSFPEFDVNVF